jgi:hypothetical protein
MGQVKRSPTGRFSWFRLLVILSEAKNLPFFKSLCFTQADRNNFLQQELDRQRAADNAGRFLSSIKL